MLRTKIYPVLVLISLVFAPSYVITSPDKKKPFLPLSVEAKNRPQRTNYTRNIAIGSLWTLTWAAAAAVSAYFAASSEELDYLYKEAYISSALALGGVAVTAHNIRNYCRSRCIQSP